MVMTNGGYTVTANGVVAHKPDWMSDDFWFRYEAPRIGKLYGRMKDGTNMVYGANYNTPTHGVEEMEDGCGSGACSI